MATIPDRILKDKPFSKWELTIKESFDLKELYKRIHDFFVEERYGDLAAGKDDFESFYFERANADGTIDHKIWWRAKKLAKSPGHENIMFWVALDYTTVRMTKKELMINGKKVTLDNGELKLEFYLWLDFEGNQEDWKHLEKNFFFKYFKRKMHTKYNRKIESLAKGEANVFSNDLYTLIQVFTGVRPESDRSRRDFVNVKGIE